MNDRNENFKKMVLDNVQDSLDQYLIINEYFEALKDNQIWTGLYDTSKFNLIDAKHLTENEYNNLYQLIKYLEKENIIEIITLYNDPRMLGNIWLNGTIQSKIKFIRR